ncbi:hypothetical protein V6N13_061387 [Hibiscus sabdariffa]
MMMASDIPAIRRMDKLKNVHSRRYSVGKIPSIPMRKIVVPKRGNFERVSGSNLVDRRKRRGIRISAKVCPDFKVQEPDDHVVIKIRETQGHHVKNVEQDSTVSAEPQKPFREDLVDIKAKYEEYVDSKSQKPVNPDCIEDGVSSWTQQVLLSGDYGVAQAKGSKLKPRSKPSSLLSQTCLSGKHNSKVLKRKEANIMSTTSFGVSRGRNKGEMTISKGIRNKKSVVLPSVSLSRKESNAQKKKSRLVYHLKNGKQIKLDKSHGTNAERSVKKTSCPIVSNSKKKPTKSNQNKVVSLRPSPSPSSSKNKPTECNQNKLVSLRPSSSSSPSKVKSMKHNQNQIPISRPPLAYEKKKMIYRPKGIQTSGLPLSLSSFLRRNSSRSTPNGLKITQPSLISLPSSTSLESFHNDTLTENDKALAETEKGSPKMMYKAKNKRASKITLTNKHLPGKKLNFQRPKVIDVPVEDSTPRRLTFKKRESVGNRNDDNRKDQVDDFTPRRLKFRQRANADNKNGDNKNSRVEEFMPKRLKFRQRVIVDNRNGDKQNGKVEELTPRRLKFRQRVIVDNRNDENQNNRIKDLPPGTPEFRQKLIVYNRNDDNQNNRIKDPPPGTPEFRQKLIVDNMNAEQQNNRVDEFTLRKRELSQSELDNINVDDQNCRGEDSPRKLIFRPKVVDETKTGYVQSPKAVTSKKKI